MYRIKWHKSDAALLIPKAGILEEAEVMLMARAKAATNLVTMLDHFERIFVVVERAPFGSIVDYADTLEFLGEILSSHQRAQVLADARCGVEQLNELGFRHGDLRARNVLLFALHPMLAKLGDFGEAAPGRTAECEVQRLQNEVLAL